MSFVSKSIFVAMMSLPLSSLADVSSVGSVAQGANVVGSQAVEFYSGRVKIAANLYLPPDFDSLTKYPAIVVAHPWGGVKEQTSGLYAQKLAKEGFVTLAFDASHYGESGGQPRDLEDPADRVQDIRSAIGYLSQLSEVDSNRIGSLGVCAGGGYTLNEAQTDLRVKAVASIVAYDIGGATRTGIQGSPATSPRVLCCTWLITRSNTWIWSPRAPCCLLRVRRPKRSSSARKHMRKQRSRKNW
ncbi:alpha/beta hydrolase [Caballeronia novacaledonica]|uniref:Dienelactone hydrolase domain-containing protein n=1 Tax=Caballeronia novacaledonica TaxID=1544861 RepID=A0AA37IIT5_9BURK|nr:alpha/beta hydrolase [Caballeronia novacaledonica]GJH27080.1 hypothetical protein CBA19CS42_21210 [Caballeronia novacaledonica]